MAKQEYRVKRYHVGDKPYHVGDTREANEVEVKHLIGKVLEPVSGKKADAPQNKKADSPDNKSAMPLPQGKK